MAARQKALGQVAFEATHPDPLVRWEDFELPDRAYWEAAARAVVREYNRREKAKKGQ